MHIAKTILIAADRRLRKMRPGSVLIIVIVLLLLLAILGAAYISTTRSARVASAQNTLNSDVDTMVNGVAKIAEGVITDDLNDGSAAYSANGSANLYGNNAGTTQNIHSAYQGVYNNAQAYNQGDIVSEPAAPTGPFLFYVAKTAVTGIAPTPGGSASWIQTSHIPITSSLVQSWLADRIPTPDGPGGATAYWPNITQEAIPSGINTPTSIAGVAFESPDGTAMPNTFSPGYTMTGLMGTQLVPDFKKVGPNYYPALNYTGTQYVAGDADGDGIADSLLFRVPGMSYDGLTWYAAVRIIDNNSAINMNTAVSRDQEFTWTGGSLKSMGTNSNFYALYQSSVGLLELLNSNDNASALNNYLCNLGSTLTTPSQAPFADPAPGSTAPTTAVPRTDFQFLTGSDAIYHQLTRRINNPGFDGAGASGSANFKALPLSDEAALAYHFCLVNPETTLTQIPPSLAETFLPFSLSYYKAATGTTPPSYYRSSPFGNTATPSFAVDVAAWFNDNFNYDAAAPDYNNGTQPIRPLVVSRNPVSNYIAPVFDSNTANIGEPLEPQGVVGSPYTAPAGTIPGMMLPYGSGPPASPTGLSTYTHFKGPWSSTGTYQFNDIVVGGDGNTYIFVVPPTAGVTNSPTAIGAPTLENLPPNSASSDPSGQGLYVYWQYQPWTRSSVKANINTATFRELYRAFWSVMAGNPSNQSPFGLNTNIYYNPYGPDPSGTTTFSPQHQFRSPLRDPTYTTATSNANVTRMDPENTMLLRAALAAVNTLGLRDNSQNVISRTVYLNAWVPPSSGTAAVLTPVMARVYSSAPNPVISEVYANTNIGTNPQGYVAVELYNPYGTPMILTNWQLGLVNRAATGGTYPNLVFTTIPANTIGPSVIAPGTATTTQLLALNDPRPIPVTPPTMPETYMYNNNPVAPGIIIIPPHGYALLENYNGSPTATAATGDATSRPPSSGLPATGIYYGMYGLVPSLNTPASPPNTCDVYVPGLQLVLQGATGVTEATASTGGELVLLRPRRCDGVYTASQDPLNTFNEGTPIAPNLYDLIPVDSYDFTGMTTTGVTTNTAFDYYRLKGANPLIWFRQIYPGRYSTLLATPPVRQTGTAYQIEPSAAWLITGTKPEFGMDVLQANTAYPNNFPPMQINNNFAPSAAAGVPIGHFPNATIYPTIVESASSPDKPTIAINNTAAPVQVPFGTFARNGDILDVPFIGSYRISQVSATVNPNPAEPINFVELNSLPMDSSFADAYTDTDTADQNLESVGRFCPIQARPTPAAGWTQPDYYSWTRNLFSYLTAQSPSDASLPNFDPNINDVVTYSTAPTSTPNIYKYSPANLASPTPILPPSLVRTSDATATDETIQDNVGVEGLININTASWKVLSMLPMVTASEDPANYAKDNESLAKAIVAWRISHGPFTSIYDLNTVIDYSSGAASTNGFQNAEGFLKVANGGAASGVSTLNGLISPPDPAFPSATSPPVFPIAPTVPGAETFGATSTGLPEDYQADFSMLNRISNLITTRSDTFTVYVEVQGWQNVGSPAGAVPMPVITRRYAYIVDRSAINADPTTRYLKTVTVPND